MVFFPILALCSGPIYKYTHSPCTHHNTVRTQSLHTRHEPKVTLHIFRNKILLVIFNFMGPCVRGCLVNLCTLFAMGLCVTGSFFMGSFVMGPVVTG